MAAPPASGRGGTLLDAGFRRVVRPFPVRDAGGTPYDLPFLGGFDVPRPQFVDIDGDGDLDLFVQERTGELVFLENVGRRGAPEWSWRTDRFQDLDVGEWSRFADLDGDGDADLLAEEPWSYVRWYRNEGGPREPRFVLAADSLRDVGGEPVFSDRQNIPQVADIDCDGVPDLFLGRVDGTVTRYEMVPGSAERGVPVFELRAERFQNIEIVNRLGRPGVSGRRGGGGGPGPSLHGANSMAFSDVDADGDLDLLWGDFFEPGVLLIENRGDCTTLDLTGDPRAVPTVSGDTLATSGYNAPVAVDIDDDGDEDLVLGVLGGAFNPNLTAADNLHLWERTDEGPLRRVTRRYLAAVDVGSESVPALGDLDGDGDPDLLVGNKIDPSGADHSRVYRFENRGRPGAPDFRLVDTLTLGDAYHYAPVLGDLDGDGDLDLVTGTWNDDVQLFRNEGSPSEARFVAAGTLVELTRGSDATPALADVDGDGDLDLFVGEASGTVNFYENVGTPQAPRFELVSDEYADIDVGRRSHPVPTDVDGDGDLDLVLGREEPGVVLYRNAGGGARPRFEEDPSFALPLPPCAAPVFVDLDGDGDADVLAGNLSGGLVFLENTGR